MMLKWLYPTLLLLSFTSYTKTVAPSQSLPLNEVSTLMRWEWTTVDGHQQTIELSASEVQIKRALTDKQRLDYSLTSPLQALESYLTPRLELVIAKINELSQSTTPYFDSVKQAINHNSDSPESILFWQAFNQYRKDAFYYLRILPCENPQNTQTACIRPNYSQLFYAHKGSLQALAHQFSHLKQNHEKIELARSWVNSIPESEEQNKVFHPPLLALTNNTLDSDERALVLASLIAEIVPSAALKLIYPLHSLGSASPTWLAIPASFNITGEQVMIDSELYVLISGPEQKLNRLINNNIELISISLY